MLAVQGFIVTHPVLSYTVHVGTNVESEVSFGDQIEHRSSTFFVVMSQTRMT